MKKILLTLVALLSLTQAWAYNFSAVNDDGKTIYYNITSSDEPYTVEVTYGASSSNSYSGAIVIPESVTNEGITYSVTGIGHNTFYNCTSLISVTIPNSVTSIGSYAFFDCLELTSIEIPNSVTSIGNSAFLSCWKLTSVEISNSITSIGDWTFAQCYELSSVTVPSSVKTIGSYTFYDCDNMSLLNLPDSLNSIGDNAFSYCLKLSAIICNAATPPTVGSNGFSQVPTTCKVYVPTTSVETYQQTDPWNTFNIMEIPSNYVTVTAKVMPYSGIGTVSGIGIYAPGDEVTLTATPANNHVFNNWTINKTIVSYDNPYTFTANEDITVTANFHNSYFDFAADNEDGKTLYYKVTSNTEPYTVALNGYKSSNNYDGDINIPSTVSYGGITYSVTSIKDDAFYYSSNLTSVVIPISVSSIGLSGTFGTFASCERLASIEVNDGNQYYDSRNDCNAIIETSTNRLIAGCKNTVIPNTVTSIESNAFKGCSSLTSIEIPNSVTSIESNAFTGCSSLTSIEIPNSVTSIGYNAFGICSGLTSIEVAADNTYYDSRDNCDAIIETATNTLITGCKNSTIPNSVTSIGNYAFYYCSGLTSIEIPNSVTSIGNYAFHYCSGLTSIEIPNSVTSIGYRAFSLSELTSIDIPNSVTSIGSDAFYNCGRLTSVEISNSVTSIENRTFGYCYALSSVTVPSSVKTIKSNAFIFCNNMTILNLPDSLNSIGYGAFHYCSKLSTITCIAATPPTVENNCFYGICDTANLYVPAASIEAYQAATPWNTFDIHPIQGAEEYTITATASPEYGGTVTGGGTYTEDDEVTLTATPNDHHTFAGWSENGDIITTDNPYIFTVNADRDLYAIFDTVTLHWTPNQYQYADNMSVTCVIHIDEIEQSLSTLEIGAFCGEECRGAQLPYLFEPTQRYILTLTVYGVSGDNITFRIYDHVQQAELDLRCITQLTFEPNAIFGSLGEPYVINFTNKEDHCHTLSAGNNWYSTYITIDGIEGLDLIKAGLGSSATMVKSQTSYTQYYGNDGWYGSLTTACNEEMYIINMTEEHEFCVNGFIDVPSEHPITLHQNWNWIGYPVDHDMPIATAFSGISPSNNDIVKSQTGYSIYYQDYGWFGGLKTMEPGRGYKLYQSATNTNTLVYPETRYAGDMEENITADGNHWIPNVNKFATNMNITAAISIDGEMQHNENLEVAAFCNGEVRGSARPMYFEPLDKYVVMLTVYGNDGDNLTFKLFDTETGIEYSSTAKESLTYSENAIVGTLTEPFVLNFNIANGISESEMSNVSIYPNPAQHGEDIMLSTTFDMVEVFNSIGIKVAEYQSVDRLKPINVAGSYIIRMTNGSAVTYGKVVVK